MEAIGSVQCPALDIIRLLISQHKCCVDSWLDVTLQACTRQ